MEEISFIEEAMKEEMVFVDVKEENDDVTDNKAGNDKVPGAEQSQLEEVRSGCVSSISSIVLLIISHPGDRILAVSPSVLRWKRSISGKRRMGRKEGKEWRNWNWRILKKKQLI